MQDILFYGGAVVTCTLACTSYYLRGRDEAAKAEKAREESAEREAKAERLQREAEKSAKKLSEDLNKLSLEKDSALAELKAAQERFAAHSQYSAELDDRVKTFALIFAFDDPALDNAQEPFSALVAGSTFGGYFSFTATPIIDGPFNKAGMSATMSVWDEGLHPDSTPRVATTLLPTYDPKTVVMDLTTMFLITGKGPKTLRELHSAAIQLFVDQRTSRRVRRFGIVANARLILDVRPRPEWWRNLKPAYPITQRALPGVAAAEFESRSMEEAIGPCLRIDLHSQIPPRLPVKP